MGYVSVHGGERAIAAASAALDALRAGVGRVGAAPTRPLPCDAIRDQLHQLHGRVLSEGGVHHPELASLAIKQAAGDPLEAAFLLRAWRASRPRLGETVAHDGASLRCIRRVSATFKELPGGQVLGPSSDYLQRLFRVELLDESAERLREIWRAWLPSRGDDDVAGFADALAALREEGLLPPPRPHGTPVDITRAPLAFPAPRSAALATMARGETGALLGIAYSSMRGYGDVHPTVAELRVGWLPVMLPHPATGEPSEAGEVLITECEIVAMFDHGAAAGARPTLGLGYGACFGHNEVKAIAMAVLDKALQAGAQDGPRHPAEDAEFVLLHVDGVDAMGFCSHYKLPHYVTFQADLDRARAARDRAAARAGTAQAVAP